MYKKSFDDLLSGYINNSLTRDDLAYFIQLIRNGEFEEETKQMIEQLLIEKPSITIDDHERADKIFENILQRSAQIDEESEKIILPAPARTKLFSIVRFVAAASIIGLVILGSYYWFGNKPANEISKTEVKKPVYKNDLPRGGNKALLTLADGSVIVLDDAKNGALTQQGNAKIIKLDGRVNYNSTNASTNEIVYNSISTPKGGQYQIVLPDGSEVWLNSTSSIRFPTAFSGKNRTVEITGEAYFEIAKNKSMPFIVKVNNAEIQVLGTHFNVMAYNDESMLNTTLLEGSVKFIKENVTKILTPGQQSQLSNDGHVNVVSNVDVNKVIAWKNGMFNYQGADIGTVLRQISRWYDVEIVYTKKVDDLFYAEIPRNTQLSDLLKALELTGKVHFEVEGKKIIVMP